MTYSVMLAAIFLAAAPLTHGQAPTRAQSELLAFDLTRQLDEISNRLQEKREQLVLATVALGSISATLAKYAPQSPEAAAARVAAIQPWIEQHEATATLELKAALLADQLQRYKETGVVSPTPASTAARLKLLIENPWTLPPSEPVVPALSLDLATLQKQLRRYEDIGRRTPTNEYPKLPRPLPQSLPAPERWHAPSSKTINDDRLQFEHDAGTGTPENDPIPDLIVLLSSTEPRTRALAADELGNRGTAAAPAVPALRSALSDPDRRVRASAALALGAAGHGDLDVVADLRRALNDPDQEVRFNARTALNRLNQP